MPTRTLVEIPEEVQAQMRAALRRARYGSLLALQILLWCAAGRTPTASAAVLFCSRSSVYRTVRAYHEGTLGLKHAAQGRFVPPVRTTVLLPMLRRSLLALLKASPRAYGWCRTRWSGATLALTLPTQRGLTVSAETMRRGLHELGWVGKRAQLVANDDDPQRVDRLASSRWTCEQLTLDEAMVFADELDSHLGPKVGWAWMPPGTQVTVMTPGQNQKHDLAGGLDLSTGTLHHCLGARQTKALFRDLLSVLEERYPPAQYTRLSVVVDHDNIHTAKAVAHWLAAHPRVTRLLLPTYCPRAHPIERAFGDVHDGCTRNHQRKRFPDLVADVEDHVHLNGPWQYKLSELYDAPAVTAAIEKIAAQKQAKVAA
jgi:putative transposase